VAGGGPERRTSESPPLPEVYCWHTWKRTRMGQMIVVVWEGESFRRRAMRNRGGAIGS